MGLIILISGIISLFLIVVTFVIGKKRILMRYHSKFAYTTLSVVIVHATISLYKVIKIYML